MTDLKVQYALAKDAENGLHWHEIENFSAVQF
jgi:hypothetical protein